ncbi:MAG TPA: hypothetical protein VK657_09890, partial [Terriglobales bacterium]|nr:hypothetical protein [Terriglobales bacterium]
GEFATERRQRQVALISGSTVGASIGPRYYRNASAMAATIKPNVASQLTVPINSSVMRQCSPAVSDGA